jgi:hypothetical protein
MVGEPFICAQVDSRQRAVRSMVARRAVPTLRHDTRNYIRWRATLQASATCQPRLPDARWSWDGHHGRPIDVSRETSGAATEQPPLTQRYCEAVAA